MCARCAEGELLLLGRAYLSNILIQHILQSLFGQETDAAGGFLAVFSTTRQGMLEMPYSVASWRFSSTSML